MLIAGIRYKKHHIHPASVANGQSTILHGSRVKNVEELLPRLFQRSGYSIRRWQTHVGEVLDRQYLEARHCMLDDAGNTVAVLTVLAVYTGCRRNLSSWLENVEDLGESMFWDQSRSALITI